MIRRKFKEEGDIERTLQFLKESNGILLAERLSLNHVKDSIDIIKSLPYIDLENEQTKALAKLTLSVKTRNY
jgi:geranylgeranyl pyrophosphate synthase